jgi:FtsZ-interacting cell division protein YlmF
VASWFRRVMYFLGLDDELDEAEPRSMHAAGDERFGFEAEPVGQVSERTPGEPSRGWVRGGAADVDDGGPRFRDAAIRRAPISDPPTERVSALDAPYASNVRPLSRDEAARAHANVTQGTSVPKTRLATPIVIAPTRFADAQDIGDQLKAGGPVIVNLEAVQRDLARRMIDFCSGITYGLGGSMKKVADQVFLLTPANVEVPEEERRRFAPNGVAKD